MIYDVAVAGLGGMGSAVLAHCAARTASVIGIDRFGRGHGMGASSGKSRLIRQAYFEHPAYVPLVLRAYELWDELAREARERIFLRTGLLTAGRAESRLIAGSLRSAKSFSLPLECWDARQTAQVYPQVRLRDGEVALFERMGGVLVPEAAIAAHLDLGAQRGAEMRFDVSVMQWNASRAGIEIRLSDGSSIVARRLILTLGPWLEQTLRELGVGMRVQRNVQVWFAPSTDEFTAAGFPAFLLERDELPAVLYGFPDLGDGVKAAFHALGEWTHADDLDRTIDEQRDAAPVARALDAWISGAAGTYAAAKACMYALTPDEHFVIDVHPQHPNVVVCGGFSGHGFKFASVVGEIAAQLAFDGGTAHPIGFLSLQRFSPAIPRSSD